MPHRRIALPETTSREGIYSKGTIPAKQPVIARPALQLVIAVFTIEVVVAVIAKQRIIAGAAPQIVIARGTAHHIIARTGVEINQQAVVEISTIGGIIAGIECVIAIGADQRRAVAIVDFDLIGCKINPLIGIDIITVIAGAQRSVIIKSRCAGVSHRDYNRCCQGQSAGLRLLGPTQPRIFFRKDQKTFEFQQAEPVKAPKAKLLCKMKSE